MSSVGSLPHCFHTFDTASKLFTLLALRAGLNGQTRSALLIASGFMTVSVNGKYYLQASPAG